MKAFIVLSVVIAVGCDRPKPNGSASEPAETAKAAVVEGLIRPGLLVKVVCDKLVSAGVAKNCKVSEGSMAATARFELPGAFPNDRGTIRTYEKGAEFQAALNEQTTIISKDVPANDFPNQFVTNEATRTMMSWGADLETDPWDVCREHKTVEACAKLYPKQYAFFQSLYEAAKNE